MSEDRYYERIEYDIESMRYVRLIYDKVDKTWEVHELPVREGEE